MARRKSAGSGFPRTAGIRQQRLHERRERAHRAAVRLDDLEARRTRAPAQPRIRQAPRYSGTVNDTPRAAPTVGADGDAVLAGLGYDASKIAALRNDGAVR